MTMQRRDVLKTGVAASLLALSGAPAIAKAKKFNYKVSTNVPQTHPINLRLVEAAEKIKADTSGALNLRVFANGQLGSDTDMLSQVRTGGIDLLTLPGVILANLVSMASLNSVGFAFNDYPHVWQAMDGELGTYIRNHISKANLVPFEKVWDNGFRQITSHQQVVKPEDLSATKIRVPPSPLLVSLFKSLDSNPTPINFNELYSALQTRVVEAQENPLPIIATGKLYEVQKHCAMTGHVWDGYWLLGNKRAMDALPPELMAVLQKHMNDAAVAQRADNEKLAADLEQELTSKGLAFNRPDPAPFRDKLRSSGFYAEWKGKFGDEAWNVLENAVGKLA